MQIYCCHHHGQQLTTRNGVEVRPEPVLNLHEQGDSPGLLTASGKDEMEMTVNHPGV